MSPTPAPAYLRRLPSISLQGPRILLVGVSLTRKPHKMRPCACLARGCIENHKVPRPGLTGRRVLALHGSEKSVSNNCVAAQGLDLHETTGNNPLLIPSAYLQRKMMIIFSDSIDSPLTASGTSRSLKYLLQGILSKLEGFTGVGSLAGSGFRVLGLEG